MENNKFDVDFKDGNLELGLDLNQDGDKLLVAKINASEAIQELMKKGGKVEGAKVVDFSFDGSKLSLMLDTDQDGEQLLELQLDLMEALDESGIMK